MREKILGAIICCLLSGCQKDVPSDYSQIKAERDSLLVVNRSLDKRIISLQDSVLILSFPADQRLSQIKSLIQEQDFKAARRSISELQSIFPSSKEAESCQALTKTINDTEARIKAEQDRIKALGFKALKASSIVKIDYNTATFSNITVGKTYVFDDYGSEHFYRTADRGYKYVTATMTIKSTSSYPYLPQCAIYKVEGDEMRLVGTFSTEFVRWKNYGTYLGNYHDFGNDFAKTNSVAFKIGCEVDEDVTKKAFAIVLKGENKLKRESRDYPHPPVYYSGYVDYPSTLSLESFSKNYTLVKMFNL